MASLLPLNSSAFLAQAYNGYRASSEQISISTARLSSGNRLVRPGDDVAALSISTRMVSELVALRQARQNISQGDSLLQVAYDALSSVGDILDSMKALATQANSGSLTDTERAFLQTEFNSLGEEIDRIAGNTSFNSIKLLDGTFSGANSVTTNTTSATKANASLVFTTLAGGETVKLNGATLTAGTQFAVGGSLQATIDNLVNYLNGSGNTDTRLNGATYARLGVDTLTITQDTGGELGNIYYIDKATSSATFTISGGTSTATANVSTLSDGADDGLGFGSVKAVGTVGDSLVNTQSQTQASATVAFGSNALNTETLTIDDGSGSAVTFTYVAASASATQITIGDNIEETIQNTIEKLEDYSGSSDFGLRQLEFERDGNNLIIRSRGTGNPLDLSATALNVGETITGANISTTTLNNGTNTGINVSGVANEDFAGEISGFEATYNSADNITVSVEVGESTYTATITDTTPASDTFVRFNSTDGGYFDIEINALGQAVGDQDAADEFAAHLDAAFSGLNFYQQRNVSAFTGTGDLTGATATIQLDDFAMQTPRITDVNVTASNGGSNAIIEVTVDGEVFRSGDIGETIGARETLTLTSTEDANRAIRINFNNTQIDLRGETLAEDFEADLRDSFGLNANGSGTNFQVGSASSDKINVRISASGFGQLFGGATPSIATQGDAEDAIDLVTTARNSITNTIAEVGAFQSRFEIAGNAVTNSITGLDTARASLADTDIIEESTIFAQASLKNQAAVAIIAQASRLQQGLLDLLQAA